ncbi:FAD-containing oxidoreductase [Terriglobus roseus]|uniref:Pyruvate/2-oxoglutarate dehydrogenase complex, dihydrolipoamide dehydrogenase (E3) component n=1 Tax=Terriglobus roseus TaxID=392734 RepID=A0A1G7GZX8_9BACT|nr:FAD-containing oxidoreductase [Terriglobus roseus]SDE93641.1 Pyruvate/2-oxoglutarate dehydrogenase complex, dihydrolipoamide dehydrogenase (E3) component [Terriglobus roseus]
MSRSFDAIVIGAGQAGIPLAARLAEAGRSVALIEKHMLGGTCVNTGCTPTKSMIASAYVAHAARRANEFGVQLPSSVNVDLAAVVKRKDEIVAQSRASLSTWIQSLHGLEHIVGKAQFADDFTVVVNGESLTSKQIFLNVGTRPSFPVMPGIDEINPLTSDSILHLKELPEHLVIVGGGYVGLEFAQMFRRFGSEVTIVEMSDSLLPREDRDFADGIEAILSGEGITVFTGAKCIAFQRENGLPAVRFEKNAEHQLVSGSHVLVAVGRTPNTDTLNLVNTQIAADEHGHIVVDEHLETSVPGVWALGDCNGRGAFTHTSYNDYEIVASNLLDGKTRRVCERIQAHALYIDPPLAQIGMTEREVRVSGRRVLIATRPMVRVGRAVERGESLGFMKVLVDAETHMILGAGILGVGGDEAIHGMLDIMYAGMPYTTITQAVHIHPTVSELIPTLLEDLKPLV